MTKHTASHVHTPNRQTRYVALALILGVVVGELVNLIYGNQGATGVHPVLARLVEILSILTDVFLRLVKIIIAPLVFSTLVVGIARMGDIQIVGRVGGQAILWFFAASICSLLLGMLLVNLFEPGGPLHMAAPAARTTTGLTAATPTLSNFVSHLFPKSIIEAMAANEILQIVAFSLFFGIACASLGELANPVVAALDSLTHIMLKFTTYGGNSVYAHCKFHSMRWFLDSSHYLDWLCGSQPNRMSGKRDIDSWKNGVVTWIFHAA